MASQLLLSLGFLAAPTTKADECGWSIISNMMMPLYQCQQSRATNGIIKSRKMECNMNQDKILLHEWEESTNCNGSSNSITYSLSSHDFNCNDTECIISSSYVRYRTYLTEKCESVRIILDNQMISDGPNIDNAPYQETTLIINHCYNDTNTPYHQMITCDANSYSIHSYLGLPTFVVNVSPYCIH